jgi:hypothetical protein
MAHKSDVKNGDLRSRPTAAEFQRCWLSNFSSRQWGQCARYLRSDGDGCDELRFWPHSQLTGFSVFRCSGDDVDHSGRAKSVQVGNLIR